MEQRSTPQKKSSFNLFSLIKLAIKYGFYITAFVGACQYFLNEIEAREGKTETDAS